MSHWAEHRIIPEPREEVNETVGPPMLSCTCVDPDHHGPRCVAYQPRRRPETIDRLMRRLQEPRYRPVVLSPAELARWIEADPSIIPFIDPASLEAARRG